MSVYWFYHVWSVVQIHRDIPSNPQPYQGYLSQEMWQRMKPSTNTSNLWPQRTASFHWITLWMDNWIQCWVCYPKSWSRISRLLMSVGENYILHHLAQQIVALVDYLRPWEPVGSTAVPQMVLIIVRTQTVSPPVNSPTWMSIPSWLSMVRGVVGYLVATLRGFKPGLYHHLSSYLIISASYRTFFYTYHVRDALHDLKWVVYYIYGTSRNAHLILPVEKQTEEAVLKTPTS